MAITKLSRDQADVLRKIADWLRELPQQHFTVGGYAGTGKSTLAAILRKLIHKKYPKKQVAFVSYTGRASQNLALKLKEARAVLPQDSCSTIHKLMYRVITDDAGDMVSVRRKEKLEYDLIILDEASMVNRDIWYDLCKYNIPILAIGDHGQLPPIGERFHLMSKPDATLEKVHRQAADNPIIALANSARQGKQLPVGFSKSNVRVMQRNSPESNMIIEDTFSSFDEDTLILCGTNKLRIQLNNHLRSMRGIEDAAPVRGDRVVCLQNIYDAKEPIYNGMIGTIQELIKEDEHRYHATIYFPQEDKTYQGLISAHQFNSAQKIKKVPGLKPADIGNLFDFGYAITVHKAQGSQAQKVLLFDESYIFKHKGEEQDAHKWLYTAITRAEEQLTVLV